LGDGLKEYAKYFVFFVILAGVAFGGVHVLRTVLKTKYPVMVVVSESMVPTLGVGDFIVVDHIDDFDGVVAAPQPDGDILVFLRPGSSDEYIVHRAVEGLLRDGEWRFVTKGDHNYVEDGQPVREGNVMGMVVGRVPILGYFPLFIKTSRGFVLVAGLMGIVFFADYLMPDKRSERVGGSFPWLSIIPFMAAPLTYLIFLFSPDNHLQYELAALALWYLGCLVAPFAFEDDDMGLMFWLYHFVLLMIPIGCDIIWWTTGITPSNWWYVEGSTVPITWLLQRETALYHSAFKQFAFFLLPGCIMFLVLVALKRRGVKNLGELNRLMRRSASKGEASFESQF